MLTAPTRPPQTSRWSPADAGFTLIELLVTLSLLGILSTIAVFGWVSWSKAAAQAGAAQKVESVLRQTQQRAVTEGSSMCVMFGTGDEWSLYRGACDSAAKVRIEGAWDTGDKLVHIRRAVFTYTNGAVFGVTFTPRGTASPGQIRITRDGSETSKYVTVEGLTGRVTIS